MQAGKIRRRCDTVVVSECYPQNRRCDLVAAEYNAQTFVIIVKRLDPSSASMPSSGSHFLYVSISTRVAWRGGRGVRAVLVLFCVSVHQILG